MSDKDQSKPLNGVCSQGLSTEDDDHYSQAKDSGSVVMIDKGKDSSNQLRAVLILTIVSIILTISVLLTSVVIFVCKDRPQYDRDQSRLPISCVECSHLTFGLVHNSAIDSIRKLSRRIEGNTELCCAHNSEQMSAMFEAVMRRQEPPEEPLPSYNVSDFKFSPVSAHKRIYPEELSQDFGNIHVAQHRRICHFKHENHKRLEHYRGVAILNKGIKILHAGLYYIYSGVQFRPQSTYPCKDFDFQTFTHSVWQDSRFGSSQLLKTTHTCCDDCINNQESRFTGGVFRLDRGDVIQIKVMEYRLVHFEPESSFAGLAMMGGFVDEEVDDSDD